MKNNLEFYVAYDTPTLDTPKDLEGTLYVGTKKDNTLYWYNNDSNSWIKSLYNLDAIKDNLAFVKVGDDWHNSFISVSEAKEYFSLIDEAQKPSTKGKALSFFITKEPISEQEGSKQAELLYVGINKNNKLYWYDNIAQKWTKSIYNLSDIQEDKDFTPVKEDWANEYISVYDAIAHFAPESYKLYAPEESESGQE